MLVKKEVIRPGTYWYVDGATGLPKRLVATPDAIKYWFDSGNEMLAAGLSIPVPVEHQSDAKPLTKDERAAAQLRNNAGWVTGFELKDGALLSVLDIQDQDIARKLPSTIKWTSPWFTSFMDGGGKLRQGVIGHVALTTRPRITRQQPFTPAAFSTIAAALSYASNLPEMPFKPAELAKDQGVAVSLAGLLNQAEGRLAPAFPVAFSLYTGIPLPGLREITDANFGVAHAKSLRAAFANDEPPPKGEPPAADPPVTPAATPPGDAGVKQLIDPDGDIDVEDVIYELMEVLGIPIPQDVDRANLREAVYRSMMEAVKAAKKPGAAMDNTNQPGIGPKNTDVPPNPIIQEAQPMMFSLEDLRKKAAAVTDPALRDLLHAQLSNQEAANQQLEALRKNAFDAAKRRREERMDRLCTRTRSDAFRQKLVTMAAGATFSLGADGTVKDSMDEALAILETGIRDLPALLTLPAGSAALAVQAHPQDASAGMTEERRQQVVEQQCQSAGVRTPAAKAG